MFKNMSTYNLCHWWNQYGKPSQATYYPACRRLRNACMREMKSRRITIRSSHWVHQKWHKTVNDTILEALNNSF